MKLGKRRIRVRSGDVIILLIIGVFVIAAINTSPGAVFDFLYSPTAGLILLIMILEFLWLKSGDRTRVYRLEIDRLRAQRRRDEDLLRRARDIIHQSVNNPATEEEGRPGDWRQRAVDVEKDIDHRL